MQEVADDRTHNAAYCHSHSFHLKLLRIKNYEHPNFKNKKYEKIIIINNKKTEREEITPYPRRGKKETQKWRLQ